VHHLVLTTPRLRLRWFEPEAAADQQFLIDMVNDPDWIANIGKRDVSTHQHAEAYLRDGPWGTYERLGFGMFVAESLDGTPVGMCGLIRRDGLDAADLGFAFLPAWRGQGLAREAAEGVLRWAHQSLGLTHLLAIVTPTNEPSIALLRHLGFVDQGTTQLPGESETLNLMAWSAPVPAP
jgi:RimJ/RimL family protein N-acetyltransferase